MEQTTDKLSKREKNAIGRIVGLVAELANVQDADEFYDLEFDGRHGFLVVKKWKLVKTREGTELDMIAKYMWKPGVQLETMGYTPLKGIQKWLEAERDVHIEAALGLGKE